MNRTRLLALCLASLALAFGPAAFAQDAQPVTVGVITSLTGRFAEFGEQHQAGFNVALEEINAAGGINGRPLALDLQDDTSEASVALSAAEGLLQEDVPLTLGAYSSSITNPLGQYFTREGRPFLVFTSSDDAITRPGSEWVYRLNQPATAYAAILFDEFDNLNAADAGTVSTIALIHGNGNFETAVADAAAEFAEERGYEIVERESYDRGVTDFRPVLNRFASANPDVVMMVSYAEDSVGIMRQANEVGLNPKMFAGGAAGFALPNFIEGAGDAANYVVTATAWTEAVPYEGAQDLYERLRSELGKEPSYHAAQAYAGLLTAADALRRAETLEPEAVQAALSATDLSTAYGPIRFESFDGYTNQNPLNMIAQQVQDGAFVTVYISPEVDVEGELQFPTPAWNER